MNGCCKFNNKAKVVDNTKCKIGDKFSSTGLFMDWKLQTGFISLIAN